MIVIDPSPKPHAYSATSLDLTLDHNIREFFPPRAGLDLTIDPTHPGHKFSETITHVSKLVQIDDANGFKLDPRSLILGWTKERVRLPSHARIAARVEGKSSLARFGLMVHLTAPTIHAGFQGQIQLEIINHGPLPIKLRSGMPVCQLIFEQTLGFPEKGYAGQFEGQLAR